MGYSHGETVGVNDSGATAIHVMERGSGLMSDHALIKPAAGRDGWLSCE